MTNAIHGLGALAYHNGEPRSSCPYKNGVNRAAWMSGYSTAKEETDAAVSDAMQDMYGDDAAYLEDCGWLDR